MAQFTLRLSCKNKKVLVIVLPFILKKHDNCHTNKAMSDTFNRPACRISSLIFTKLFHMNAAQSNLALKL